MAARAYAGHVFGAVDLGASSGRVIAGEVDPTAGDGGMVALKETARFPNGPIALPTPGGTRLYWDVLRLWEAILHGLEAAAHDVGPLEAVGIDSWAVDYGLIEDGGVLAGNPSSYRCSRTDGIPARVFGTIPAEHAYSISGTGMNTFNTIFQFAAEQPGRLNRMDAALLLPDLFGYWLTGRRVAEVTNASSTGLLDARSRDWSPDLLSAMEQHFEAPLSRLLPGVVEPGTVLGPARPDVLPLLTPAGEATPLVAVATHDTASAVVGVPADTPHFAYISCGTWSLVGLELDAPVLTEESRAANFTNELGLDGTVRYLRNVAGLWVLNECLRDWRAQRLAVELPDLLAQAARETPLRTLIDLNQETFLHLGDMPDRVVEAARLAGQPVPLNPAQITRCLLDSLALAYRQAVHQASRLADRPVHVVHMVGGGIRNELLCRLTADATGLPVVAGPEEGTAMGNVLVQARAVGVIDGDLSAIRTIVRNSTPLRRYEPDPGPARRWDAEVGATETHSDA